MTNSKNTKRALLASVLSMMLCMAMLVGTTFAWFTDSVTSSGNKIQAGKLDIVLEELQEGGYVDISDSDAPLFNQEALWEPGYSEAHVLRVVNNGNLALKYKMEIVVKNAVPGVNLADVIEVYAYNPAGAAEINALPTSFDEVKNSGASDPSTGYKFVGTLSELMAKETGIAYGFMKKDSAPEYYGFVFHMKEEAGNEYQGLSIGDSFDIVLKATQWTYESDSFGKDYDENAEYPIVVSLNSEDKTTDGKLIVGDETTAVSDTLHISGSIDTGKTECDIDTNYPIPVVVKSADRATVVIENAVLNGAYSIAPEAGKTIENLIFRNCKINGVWLGYPDKIKNITYDGCTFNQDGLDFENFYTANAFPVWYKINGNVGLTKNITFTNNTFNTNRGIHIESRESDVNLTIENNTFNMQKSSASNDVEEKVAAVQLVNTFNGAVNIKNNEMTSGYQFIIEYNGVAFNGSYVVENNDIATGIIVQGPKDW